jgi:RNA polymerase sigma factor (sigma-70 family)
MMQALPTIRRDRRRRRAAVFPSGAGAHARAERIAARGPGPSPTRAEKPEVVIVQHRPSLPLDLLEKAAECLRPVEREVLILHARERLSRRDIAARLGIAPGKAERILANAIFKLARSVDRVRRKEARHRRWWQFRRTGRRSRAFPRSVADEAP